MSPVPPEIVQQLYAPLPAEAIAQHPSKKFLSTIKAIYVIERLNEVFGMGGWTYKVKVIENAPASPMIVVRVRLFIPAYSIVLEQFGGNDNPDRGDAYKGAVTDALSKLGSYLGIGIAVHKGQGPTQQNGGRTEWQQGKAAAKETAQKRIDTLQRKPAQPAAVMVPPEPEDEDRLTQQLLDSLDQIQSTKEPNRFEMLKAFGELKTRFARLHLEDVYYGYLASFHLRHANEFGDDPQGRLNARKCYKIMSLDLQEREVQRKVAQ